MTYRPAGPILGVPAMSATNGSLGWSSAALLVGDAGIVVVDTGGPGYRARWDERLAHSGLSRSDVTLVLLTHCHWDHIGALSWFPRAAVGVGRDEYRWAVEHAETDPYLEPALVRVIAERSEVRLLDHGDRIAGVEVVATPGHTPGHLSYAVDTTDGPLLVVGDAVKNGVELRTGRFAATGDPDLSAASLALIRRYAREKGHRLLLGHDGVYADDGGGAFRPVDPRPVPVDLARAGCLDLSVVVRWP